MPVFATTRRPRPRSAVPRWRAIMVLFGIALIAVFLIGIVGAIIELVS
jgi:hypothetical protein